MTSHVNLIFHERKQESSAFNKFLMIFETISVPIRVLMKGNTKAQPLLISDDL